MTPAALHIHCRTYHTPSVHASHCAVCDSSFDSYRLVTHMRQHADKLQFAKSASDEVVTAAYAAYLQSQQIDTSNLHSREAASTEALHRLASLQSYLQQHKPIGINFEQKAQAQRPLPFVAIERGFMWYVVISLFILIAIEIYF